MAGAPAAQQALCSGGSATLNFPDLENQSPLNSGFPPSPPPRPGGCVRAERSQSTRCRLSLRATQPSRSAAVSPPPASFVPHNAIPLLPHPSPSPASTFPGPDPTQLLGARLWRSVQAIHPSSTRRDEVFQLAHDAQQYANLVFGQDAAVKWAEGFVLPCDRITSDEEDFARCSHNMTIFAASRQARLAPSRLSHARVNALHPMNPERAMLTKLVEGMVVPTPPAFVPNGSGEWPSLRPSYVKVSAAVDKCFYEHFVEKGLAVILSAETVRRWLPEAHISVASWTPKHGKPCGRPLTDCSSGGSEGRSVLNGNDTRDLCREEWGPVCHPLIAAFVLMILRQQAVKGHEGGRNLVLWAGDVSAAYTRLFFHPAAVQWVAVQLLCGAVVFFLAGIFGWTGTPFAFDVVTRALTFELQTALGLQVLFYVDDVTGVCAAGEAEGMLMTAERVINSLLGPGSLEKSKNRSGRRLDVIGFTLDLDTQCVTIARKNVLRTVYGFFLAEERPGWVSVRTLERLASWSSRYALVCTGLRPFVNHLYAAQVGRPRNADVPLKPTLRFVIALFQALLTLSFVEERLFSRSFASFAPRALPPTCVFEFDASLTGGGGLIYAMNGSSERIVGGFILDFAPLGLQGQPAYQNVCEFLTAAVALLLGRQAGLDVRRPLFRGDSITALDWLEEEHFRSTNVSLAATLFVFTLAKLNVESVRTLHLPKEVNTRADDLSRNVPWSQLQRKHPELRGGLLLHLDQADLVIRLCNPSQTWSSSDQLFESWKVLQRL